MTDLEKAIAEMRSAEAANVYTEATNEAWNVVEVAVLSGELIPATERDAAVAAALEKAVKAVPQEPPYATAESQIEHGRVIGYKDAADYARSAILALINQPQADALARVRAEDVAAELVRIEMEWRSHPSLDAARRNLRSRAETISAAIGGVE